MKISWLIKNSIELDYLFFKQSNGTVYVLEFMLKKYALLLKHAFTKFVFGKHFVYLHKKKVYYDSKYGIAGYQRALSSHKKMLRSLIELDSVDDKKMTILDVGAHVGYFSLVCNEVFNQPKIYAFEPIEHTYNLLNENTKYILDVEIFNLGIGDKQKIVRMSYDPEYSSLSHASESGNLEVKVITLDSFLNEKNIGQIDLLKIDTETYEKNVLQGAKETLAKTRFLHMEITLQDNDNYTISEIFCLLRDNRFDYNLVYWRIFDNICEGKPIAMDALFENKMMLK